MRKFLPRLLPDSIFGRFLITLVVSCALAQLVGASLILQSGGSFSTWVRIAIADQAARRLVDTLDSLKLLSPPLRQQVLQELTDTTVDIELALPPSPLPADAFDRTAFGDEISTRFAERFGRQVELDYRLPAANDDALMYIEARGPGAPPLHFRITSFTQAERDVSARTRLIVQLFILFVCIAIGVYIAARRVTRPLSMLASKAVSLGSNLNQPPLTEVGPREVRKVSQALNEMQDRLRRHIESRTRIVAAMSHDLRTPLTRMRLRAETLETAERGDFIDDIIEMDAMVVSSLDALSDLAAEEPTQQIDINELLARLRSDFTETGGRVTIHGEARNPYVGRLLALKRCLANLIDNAIKFGDVAMISVRDGDELRIVIADRGPGIPEEELERVFEPFYRLESSRSRDTGGAGLGLSIARDNAQAHGGRLIVRNREQGGLEVVLVLPRS